MTKFQILQLSSLHIITRKSKIYFHFILGFWCSFLGFHVIMGSLVWGFALVGWWWLWWRCHLCSSSPKAKPCWHNTGSQTINQFYWRVVKNKYCNMIGWNQADQLSGFPAGLYLSVVTVTLPPRPHESFSGPGKVIPSKLFTNRSGSGCWTWDLRGWFFCFDQIDISGGAKAYFGTIFVEFGIWKCWPC